MRRVVKTADAAKLAKEHQEALCRAALRTDSFAPSWKDLSEADRRARVAAARDLLEREVVDVRSR